MSLEQIRAFMAASEDIRFEGHDRKEIYNWVRETVIEKAVSRARQGSAHDKRDTAAKRFLRKAMAHQPTRCHG